MALRVQCPNCQAPVEWTDVFPYRPFCSLRCKNDDLCAWADEKHALPVDAETDDRMSETLDEPG